MPTSQTSRAQLKGNGEVVISLEMRNKHLEIALYGDQAMINVRSGTSTDYIVVGLWFDKAGVPIDSKDLYDALMEECIRQGKGKRTLAKHSELIEWSWNGLMRCIKPIDIEDMHTVYQYDS
jgi:hypothetical protein